MQLMAVLPSSVSMEGYRQNMKKGLVVLMMNLWPTTIELSHQSRTMGTAY